MHRSRAASLTTRCARADDRRVDGDDARRWRAWAAASLVTALAQAATFVRPILDTDEATYASIAALMNEGGRLYAEGGVDNKPPGIYWTYAAVFALFGRYAMFEVHLLKVLVVVATAAVVAAITRRAGGRGFEPAAFALYGVFTAAHYPKMAAANTEAFMMLPLCASFLVLLAPSSRRSAGVDEPAFATGPLRACASGVLVGVACLFKQVAAVNLVLVCVAVLVARRAQADAALHGGDDGRRRSAGAASSIGAGLLGFAVVLGAVALLFARRGTLDDLWRWTVVKVLFEYGPGIFAQGVDVPLARFAASFPQLLLFTALLWLLAASAARRGRRLPDVDRALLAWCALGLVAAFAGGRFYGHYYIQVIGPLAVVGALELRRLHAALPPRRRRARAAIAAFLVVAPAAYAVHDTARYEPISDRYGAPDPDWRPVVDHLRRVTAPDDRLFVWGMCAPLYVLADRVPATRFVGFLRGFPRSSGLPADHSWDAGPDVWPVLLQDLRARPPRLIVDTSTADYQGFGAYPMSSVPALRDLLVDYELETTVAGVDLYRRRAGPSRLR